MNKSMHRFLRLSLFLYTCLAVITGCENDAAKVFDLTQRIIHKEEAVGVDSYLSQNGVLKARLQSPRMLRVFADTLYIEFPQTLEIEFYNDEGKVETRLRSLYGKYFENYQKAYLRDSVVVTTVYGDTLRSPDLWWDQNARLFYTEKFATYRGIGKQIYGGKGVTATQDLNSVIFHQPTGVVKLSESGMPY
ncbi:MAG: LPS export ABC transporter periplasmic protein LptC [Chitinophagaceae bacterium]|nr:LPS export ABC transporter periplasmic protein LptC [Chitinophagaceae bacterium]